MADLIAIFTLLISIIGMATIIYRKLPVLIELSEIEPRKEDSLVIKIKARIKKFNPFKNFSYELFLQKLLSKIRILTLKTDTRTFNWLQKLRQKTKKKKLDDNYWEEIKKIKKRK